MFPLNFNLQKITLLEALRYVVPLIPGSIIVAAAAMGSSNAFRDFMHIPELGYYAKLLLLLAAAYLVGLVLDEITTLVMGGTFGLLTAWVVRAEKRRKIIDTLAVAVAPWRDATWQKLATSYIGPEIAPTSPNDTQWRSWYLVIKASFPYLDEGVRRSAILMDAAHTSCWALLIARLILPGYRYLIVFIALTITCFGIAAFNKIMLVLSSFGYFASDLTGAALSAAMLDEIRKEKGRSKAASASP